VTRPLLLLALVVTGCATARMSDRPWPTLQVDVKQLAARHPRARAVVVRQEGRYAYVYDSQYPWRAERYEAIAVLTEGGERYADVGVPVGDGQLRFLRARTTSPDGTVQEVQPEEVHEAVGEATVNGLTVSRTAKLFRLPGVRVGSLIEYSYGIAYPKWPAALDELISREIPIQHYHLEFNVPSGLVVSMHVYNHPVDVLTDSKRGVNRAFVDIDDIPSQRKERFAPPITFTEPWWNMVVKAARIAPFFTWALYETWPDTLQGLGVRLYLANEKLRRGLSLKPDIGACAPGSRCLLERALALINDKTELSGFASSPTSRPLQEVVDSHTANNFEKAILLREALESVGVHPRYALVARNPEFEFDRHFPAPNRGDHLVLYLDKAPGFSGPLFLDPSCEWCQVGQIPSWIQGRQAIVFRTALDKSWRGSSTDVEWVLTSGAEAKPSVDRRSIDVQLDPSGSIQGRVERELSGAGAVAFRIHSRTWLDGEWQKEAERVLREHSVTAELRGSTPASWSKQEARLRFAVEYGAAGYAAVDGDRLVVPLSFLHGDCDEDFGDEPRAHDVMIREAKRDEETLTLHLPSGYVAAELPPGLALHTDAADGAVDVTAAAPGTIRLRRMLQTHVGHWGPAEFDDVAALMRKLAAVRQEVVILKKAAQ
jgi:hypothetical protein